MRIVAAASTMSRVGSPGCAIGIALSASRVESVVGEISAGESEWDALYSAVYAYHADRDLVETVTYGNGTTIEYAYDDLDRVEIIRHLDPNVQPGPLAILEIEYTYDARGLIDLVEESGIDGSAIIDYGYDNRGRLIEEERAGDDPYHLAYSYDAGSNRETRVDVLNSIQTTYYYDLNNNRLLWYYVSPTEGSQSGFTVERVEYEYAENDAAGNVRRVVRKVPDPAGPMPDEWFVFATEFCFSEPRP